MDWEITIYGYGLRDNHIWIWIDRLPYLDMDDRLPYMDDILPYMDMDDRLPLSLEICFLHTKQKRKDKMAATQDSMCSL